MQISDSGIAFIKENEGFSATPYQDAGHWAWGYGHDQKIGEPFPTSVTESEATAQLIIDLDPIQATLNKLIPSDCTQNQYDALCDFGYNDGIGAIWKLLSHGWSEIPVQMLRWDFSAGKVNKNLQARREKEVAMFTQSSQ